MRRGTLTLLLFVILLAAGSSFVVFWPHADNDKKALYGINNPFTITEGLDLQGGVRVQLTPQKGQPTDDVAMENTRNLIEKRVNNGFGVKEPSVRLQRVGTSPSIVVDLPSFSGNQGEALDTLLKTGVLEFWNTGSQSLPENSQFVPEQFKDLNPNGAQFKGDELDPNSLQVGQDPNSGAYQIEFAMKGNSAGKLSSFTAQNTGQFMTVTLDKKVITSPRINGVLPGKGSITGQFTQQSATDLTNLLKYGSLPVALEKVSEETIGGTLGTEAIQKSLLGGGIGLGVVVLFMLLYYRLPGLLADVALVLYAIFTFAVFKMIGVTLTLAGIAGFILSIGMAVDANVLIFERVKEELRAGRLLEAAIDTGWKRAWPSIRDSNSATFITCAILYAFGSNFGATIIVGFATTLFLGVVISMFTAIVVTRTLLNLLVPTGVINHPALFGLPADAVPATTSRLAARRNSAV